MKKIFLLFMFLIVYSFSIGVFSVHAADDFVIIPEASGDAYTKKIEELAQPKKQGEDFFAKYRDGAESMKDDLGGQVTSGIMNWDTILNFAAYLAKFMSQLALVAGAAMIIYAGYIYATGVFSQNASSSGKNAIKHAIIGIVVVAFSYSIIKIITSMFL